MDRFGDLATGIAAYTTAEPLRAALAILVACSVLAFAVEYLVRLILRRAVAHLASSVRGQLEHALRGPVRLSILLAGAMGALVVASPGARLEALGLAAGQTLLVVLWTGFGLRALRIAGTAPAGEPLAQATAVPLVRSGLMVVLVLVAAYLVLVAWDVNVTGLVASAGIVGLALSFAAQDTLGNLVAGIAILTDKPYRIGDYIVLDTGERGEVTHIGLRSTRLLTRDDVEVSIPNGQMGRAKIVNESGGPSQKYRLRIAVPVAYGEDLDQAMELMLAAAAAHPQVCATPEPRMRLREFGDSSLRFEMLCWIEQPAQRGLVAHDLNCGIYRAFAAAGVKIPFPQRDVWLHDARGSRTGTGEG
jgi:small-conductance mechanosensitive channel